MGGLCRIHETVGPHTFGIEELKSLDSLQDFTRLVDLCRIHGIV